MWPFLKVQKKKNIIDQQLYKFEMILPFHTGFPSWERLGLIKSLPYMRNLSSDDKIFEKNYIHSWFSDSYKMNVTELNRMLHEVTPFSCQSAWSLENKRGHVNKFFFFF